MGFLEGEGPPDFDKAVFSLWFRVPQASIDAARAEKVSADAADLAAEAGYINTEIGYTSAINGVIPLVMFGENQTVHAGVKTTSKWSGSMVVTTGWIEEDGTDFMIVFDGVQTPPNIFKETSVSAGQPYLLPPSFIGVLCPGDSQEAPTIVVYLVTKDKPVRTGILYNSTEVLSGPVFCVARCQQYDRPFDGRSEDNYAYTYRYEGSVTGFKDVTNDPPPLDGHSWWTWPPGAVYNSSVTLEDVSELSYPFPGQFNILGPTVSADEWHHLLISFDLSGNVVNDTSDCRMWMALDDVDYEYMKNNNNKIFPYGAGPPTESSYKSKLYWSSYGGAGEGGAINNPYNTGGVYLVQMTVSGESQGSFALGPSKISAALVGVPATSERTKETYQVQMAELQIFTGVTLDTGVEENRRAFINTKGEPVDPLYSLEKDRGIFGPATPNATPSPPIELLGKAPDISLTRKMSNWVTGLNLGTAKTKFKPTGKIRPVKPDPVLGR